MRRAVQVLLGFVLAAATAAPAIAHGGTYRPGAPQAADPGPSLGPPWHGPKFKDPEEPGNGDPKGEITRWETWWAANRDAWLRLSERLGGDAPGTTPSGVAPSEREQAAAAKRAAALRRRLAPLFVEALADKEFEVRTAAAIALGKTGEAIGSDALRAAAKGDAHKDVRDSAVLGLGLLGRASDIPFLDEMLSDPSENPRRRAFAACALGLIGGEDAAASLLRFSGWSPESGAMPALAGRPELAASVFAALGLAGDVTAVGPLRAAAADPAHEPNVRSFAWISLGRLHDHESVAACVSALRSEKEAGIRRAVAIALGKLARPTDAVATTALLAAVVEDADPVTRHFAAIALGGLRDPSVSAELRKRFAASTPAERTFTALAIGIQGDKEFAPQLRGALTSPGLDESSAGSLCIALGLLGDIASAEAIQKTLADAKSAWVRGYAALALGLVGATSSIEPLHKRLETEKDPRLRMNLAIALGLLHDPRAKDYLVDTFRKADTFFERSSAAMAIGALRLAATVPDLEAVYRDANERDVLRAFSVVALGQIADPSPVPKLQRFSIDGNYDGAAKVDPLNEILSIF